VAPTPEAALAVEDTPAPSAAGNSVAGKADTAPAEADIVTPKTDTATADTPDLEIADSSGTEIALVGSFDPVTVQVGSSGSVIADSPDPDPATADSSGTETVAEGSSGSPAAQAENFVPALATYLGTASAIVDSFDPATAKERSPVSEDNPSAATLWTDTPDPRSEHRPDIATVAEGTGKSAAVQNHSDAEPLPELLRSLPMHCQVPSETKSGGASSS